MQDLPRIKVVVKANRINQTNFSYKVGSLARCLWNLSQLTISQNAFSIFFFEGSYPAHLRLYIRQHPLGQVKAFCPRSHKHSNIHYRHKKIDDADLNFEDTENNQFYISNSEIQIYFQAVNKSHLSWHLVWLHPARL